MFSNEQRCQYHKHQLVDVICQLRFPDILTINANQPADFQEAIRFAYPQFTAKIENPSPRITDAVGNILPNNQQTNYNYQFASADGTWRVNLTSRFISLACSKYNLWEDFAKKLDIPLAAFIKIYSPSYFQRIGLRYINFFSRENLGLEEFSFSQLFQPAYLGLLGDPDVAERQISQSSIQTECTINHGCRVKIHAGPGTVRQNGHTDGEVKFIFDQDLFMSGNIPVTYSASALENLHSQAYPIFRGAITDSLHNALEPTPIH